VSIIVFPSPDLNGPGQINLLEKGRNVKLDGKFAKRAGGALR